MNEVDSEAHSVLSARVRKIVSELIFLLVARNRERGNRGGELIVPEGLEPRRG